jgi:hypothetical protein
MRSRSDRELGALIASLDEADGQLLAPPADLWDAIVDELSSSSVAAAADPGVPAPSNVRTLGSGPRRTAAWMMLAAAAVVLLVGALVALDRSSVSTVGEVALSSNGLAGAPPSLSGRAELVETAQGLQLDVQLPTDIDTAGGYLELWLIDTNVDGMVSLGPVNESGRYPIPAGVDPGRFPIVDVSVEPPDGLPTHSGVSVLRGVLET